MDLCCGAQAVTSDLWLCFSATCWYWIGQSPFQCAFAFFGVLGEYSLSTCEASDVILLLLIAPS